MINTNQLCCRVYSFTAIIEYNLVHFGIAPDRVAGQDMVAGQEEDSLWAQSRIRMVEQHIQQGVVRILEDHYTLFLAEDLMDMVENKG